MTQRMKQDLGNNSSVEQIEHLNRVLLALRRIGKILITENDPIVLIQSACDILVENRGYYNAWICLADEGGTISHMVHAGLLRQFGILRRQVESGNIPRCINKLMVSDKLFSTADPHDLCLNCVLSEPDVRRGVLAARLVHDQKTYGFMVLYIPRKLSLDPFEKIIVQEIANDIALGLYRIDLEKKRRAAEQYKSDSNARFKALVENSLNCIVIALKDEILYYNTGRRPEHRYLKQVFKPPDFPFVYSEDKEAVKKAYHDLLDKNKDHVMMDFRYHPAGESKSDFRLRWALLSARLIDYLGVESVLVNMMDTTNSKEVEKFLQIQDKMASLGRVTAGMAHEIRNPLSGINIYLKALKKRCMSMDNSGDTVDIIDKIEMASHKVESIVRRVMDFSKPGNPRFVMVNLNEYIDDVAQLTSVTLRRNGIRFVQDLDGTLPDCWAEPHLIEQVILNIITNAVEAMKDFSGEKSIELKTRSKRNSMLISIKDTGPGIPQAIHSRVFDPFYTTKANSSGIGLSICHRVITDHGGSLKLKSRNPCGVEFLIELPLEKGGQV